MYLSFFLLFWFSLFPQMPLPDDEEINEEEEEEKHGSPNHHSVLFTIAATSSANHPPEYLYVSSGHECQGISNKPH